MLLRVKGSSSHLCTTPYFLGGVGDFMNLGGVGDLTLRGGVGVGDLGTGVEAGVEVF